jgi:GTP cyclohydrolase IA
VYIANPRLDVLAGTGYNAVNVLNESGMAEGRMIATEAVRAVQIARGVGGGRTRREADVARIEAGVREILLGLGENPDREGLEDTPARVARAFMELTAGTSEVAGDHLSRVFAQEHAGDDVVMLKGIRFVSLCEHHMLPFTGVAHVAYLPSHGRVAGLSKLARTVDVFARRLQMQERLTSQIAEALLQHLDPRGVAVVVEAEHSCLRLRGARKEEAHMVTTAFRGAMEHDRALRAEVLSLMGVGAAR